MGIAKIRNFITGMGIVTSIGNNIEEFNISLVNGKHGVSIIEDSEFKLCSVKIAAILRNFFYEQHLQKYLNTDWYDKVIALIKILRNCTLSTQVTLCAAFEAWFNASLYQNVENVACIVCGSNFNQYHVFKNYKKFSIAPQYISPSYAMTFMDSDLQGVLAEIFSFGNENWMIGGASAAGNLGFLHAFRMIQEGYANTAIVIGPMTDLSPIELEGLVNAGVIQYQRYANEPDKVSRPFDSEHEGLVYGQGAGVIILESEEIVHKYKKQPLCEVLSVEYINGNKRAMQANLTNEKEVMRKAIEQAKIDLIDINYINAHGTSTPLGDDIEAQAIEELFSESLSKILVNSTKSLIGHCLSSAAIIELIAICLQFKNNYCHKTLNLLNPINNHINFVKETVFNVDLQYAISNSFAFNDINTCVVLKKIGI